MELPSLVEQYHNSPDLVRMGLWIIGGLAAGYAVVWFITRSFIKWVKNEFESRDDQRDRDLLRVRDLSRDITDLKLELRSNYVSFKLFNDMMKEFKSDFHSSLTDVKAELKEMNRVLHNINLPKKE